MTTVAEVERIAAMTDPVIRNLRITECYSRLAAAMGPDGSNWCTYATWASRQAGRTGGAVSFIGSCRAGASDP